MLFLPMRKKVRILGHKLLKILSMTLFFYIMSLRIVLRHFGNLDRQFFTSRTEFVVEDHITLVCQPIPMQTRFIYLERLAYLNIKFAARCSRELDAAPDCKAKRHLCFEK